MNILLVDDDPYVIEALQRNIDWISLKIQGVYSAQSVSQAKEIIRDVPIQLVLCDIEMPRENGFVLLTWIREQEYIMQVILLTSYAEFEYATQAIRLSCLAYALKPLNYEELEEHIRNAMAAQEKALETVNFKKYYSYWTTSEKMRKEEFFRSLCLKNESYTGEQTELLIREMGLGYGSGQQFVPVVFEYFVTEKENDTYKKGMFEWNRKNLISTTFSTVHVHTEAIIPVKEEEFLAVLLLNQGDMPEIGDNADRYRKRLKKRLGIDCCITIGEPFEVMKTQAYVTELLKACERHVISENQVIYYDGGEEEELSYVPPDFSLWEDFLFHNQEEAVIKAADEYLDKLAADNKLDKCILDRFILDFIQMVGACMNRKNIRFQDMESSFFTVERMNNSLKSLPHAKICIYEMLHIVAPVLKKGNEAVSMAQRVKEYIDQNLDKDITRESLAEMVFLNQDYLARIFKKEIGDSIGNYLIRKRIAAAKEYLERTNEQVNAIAVKVGYDNFSYFSKVFKTSEGVTPKEYRRLYQISTGKNVNGFQS